MARRLPVLRFNVRSTGRGTLQVLLKTHYVRGSYRLKAGKNRIRVRLPKSVRSGRHQIVLTVYSTTGTRGQRSSATCASTSPAGPSRTAPPNRTATPAEASAPRSLESGHVL